MKRRVVVTGLGAVTSIGYTFEEIYNSILEKKCAIGPIESFDATDFDAKMAGEVKDFDPTKFIDRKSARRMDRVTQFGVYASQIAFEDAGFKLGELSGNSRCGVIVGSGIGGIETIEIEHSKGIEKGFNKISPFFIPMSIINMTSAQIGIHLGLNGQNYATVTACAAGSDSIGQAFRSIRDGYSDLMIAGGSEASITPLGVGGFVSMKALSTSTDPNRASIPFDAERDGFVMGEGAGILVLEELEHAKARGAKIYGEIVGYGTTSDAFHITAPHEDGKYASIAILDAIKESEIDVSEVDYINAHGTSTKLNDAIETKAVKTVFKDHAKNLYMSSTKSMTGHLLGASGALEAIISLVALNKNIVPATLNYKVPDEECDLNIVPNEPIEKELNYVMSNSLGFGGHNASLLFKRWKDA